MNVSAALALVLYVFSAAILIASFWLGYKAGKRWGKKL